MVCSKKWERPKLPPQHQTHRYILLGGHQKITSPPLRREKSREDSTNPSFPDRRFRGRRFHPSILLCLVLCAGFLQLPQIYWSVDVIKGVKLSHSLAWPQQHGLLWEICHADRRFPFLWNGQGACYAEPAWELFRCSAQNGVPVFHTKPVRFPLLTQLPLQPRHSICLEPLADKRLGLLHLEPQMFQHRTSFGKIPEWKVNYRSACLLLLCPVWLTFAHLQQSASNWTFEAFPGSIDHYSSTFLRIECSKSHQYPKGVTRKCDWSDRKHKHYGRSIETSFPLQTPCQCLHFRSLNCWRGLVDLRQAPLSVSRWTEEILGIMAKILTTITSNSWRSPEQTSEQFVLLLF